MTSMIACCGLNCSECPTFLATQANDPDAKAKVAALWSKQFGMKLSAEDMNCDGCLSDTGRLFGHCTNCNIRKCAQEKGSENCAPCPEYPCESLNAFYTFVPHAKEGIEKIRRSLA